MPPSGLQARKVRPSSSHSAISGSEDRNAGENWFCTAVNPSPITSRARRIWPGSALEMPACAIRPSSSSAFSPPRVSSYGVAGSGRWCWKRSIRSTPRRSIEAMQARRRYAAEPSRCQSRAGPGVPALGRHEDLAVAGGVLLERLGDQPLVGAEVVLADGVGVGGVDQRHPELQGPDDRGDPALLVVDLAHRHRHRPEPDRAHLSVPEPALRQLLRHACQPTQPPLTAPDRRAEAVAHVPLA